MTTPEHTTTWIDVAGVPTDARQVRWIETAPCGCWDAVAVAEYRGCPPDQVIRSAPDAFADRSKAVRDLHERQGFTWAAIHVRDYDVERFADCPHTPKWGVPADPTPIGWAWATTDWWGMVGRVTHRRHLIPADRAEVLRPVGVPVAERIATVKATDRARREREGATVTVCLRRVEATRGWFTDDMGDTVPCVTCSQRAARMVAAEAAGVDVVVA